MDSDPVDPATRECIARVRRAIALTAEGAFCEAIELLDNPSRGELGEMERAIRDFVNDHKIAVEQSAITIEEFAVSQRELEAQLNTIKEQQSAIQRLSAPIIDVWDGIVTIPLIGVLHGNRAQEITERLLARIQQTHTAWVVLDLTGTDRIDSVVASRLIEMATAVRLMGARCLVASMRAHVAQTLASLGTPLEGLLRPMPSLKESLQYCLSKKGAAERA